MRTVENFPASINDPKKVGIHDVIGVARRKSFIDQ
jgi:hypothetical protein